MMEEEPSPSIQDVLDGEVHPLVAIGKIPWPVVSKCDPALMPPLLRDLHEGRITLEEYAKLIKGILT